MTTWHNLRGPSVAAQIAYSQPDPAFEKWQTFRAALLELIDLIGVTACKEWQGQNLSLSQSLDQWTDLVRAELRIRRGMAELHRGAQIAAKLGVPVECDHFLPEQSCPHCNPTLIAGRDPEDIPY